MDISHLFYASGVDAAHRIALDLKDALLLSDDTDVVVKFILEFEGRTMSEGAIGQPPDTWIATGRLGTDAWRQRVRKVHAKK